MLAKFNIEDSKNRAGRPKLAIRIQPRPEEDAVSQRPLVLILSEKGGERKI